MIIKTLPYKKSQLMSIINIRAKVEKIELSEGSLEYLAEIGKDTSLRYAIQLLTPSSIISQSNGKKEVEKSDIEETVELFFDSKKSAKILINNKDSFIY
jgi:RuvB-like protein 1